MKQFWKYSLITVLALSFGLLSSNDARGQFVVEVMGGVINDPGQTAANEINTGLQLGAAAEQLAKTIKEIGILDDTGINVDAVTGWLDDTFGEGSTYMKVYETVKDYNSWRAMIKNLNFQIQNLEKTWQLASEFKSLGYSTQMTTRLLRQTNSLLRMMERTVEKTKEILADTGLSKAEKQQKADEMAREANEAVIDGNDELIEIISIGIQETCTNEGLMLLGIPVNEFDSEG